MVSFDQPRFSRTTVTEPGGRGDCGSGCVEPMVQLRTLTSFVFEFLLQSDIVLMRLARREALARGDAVVPFGQYPGGAVHGGAA
jgi:hypothetical protein